MKIVTDLDNSAQKVSFNPGEITAARFTVLIVSESHPTSNQGSCDCFNKNILVHAGYNRRIIIKT